MIERSKERGASHFTRDTGCKTEYPSFDTANLWNEQECNKYWEKANQVMNNQYKPEGKEFKTAHRIKISGKYCYKPDLFTTKGWCDVAHTPKTRDQNTRKWGYCSTSCRILFMQVTYIFISRTNVLVPYNRSHMFYVILLFIFLYLIFDFLGTISY